MTKMDWSRFLSLSILSPKVDFWVWLVYAEVAHRGISRVSKLSSRELKDALAEIHAWMPGTIAPCCRQPRYLPDSCYEIRTGKAQKTGHTVRCKWMLPATVAAISSSLYGPRQYRNPLIRAFNQ